MVGTHVWANKNLKKKENMEKEQDHASDADPMGLSFDVIIYIYVDIVLEK